VNRTSVAVFSFLVSLVIAIEIRRSNLANRELAEINLLPTVTRLTLATRSGIRAKGLLYLSCDEAKELRIVAHAQLPIETNDIQIGILDDHNSFLFDDNVHGGKRFVEFPLPSLRLQRRGFLDLIVSEPLESGRSIDLVYLLQNYKPTEVYLSGFNETSLRFRLLTNSVEIKTFTNQCQQPTAS
jgi:hypothetical protein